MTTTTEQNIDWAHWLHADRLWWPWNVALAYYERKVGIGVSRNNLIRMGRLGYFRLGKAANCPSRLAPVDRSTFMAWVHGNGTKPRTTKRNAG